MSEAADSVTVEKAGEDQVGSGTGPKRIIALDVLRGLALLGMALSGLVSNNLPAWMYHCQSPPPDQLFDPTIPGITWVDLVFPMFLFALGAAIPIALGRKLDSGSDKWSVGLGILKRGVLLAVFAFASEHFRLDITKDELTAFDLWAAFLLFFATVAAFASWPKKVPAVWGKVLTGVGIAVMVSALFWLPSENGFNFDNDKVDIILLVLANVAVLGAFIWWATRESPLGRLAVMSLVAAVFFTREMGAIGQQVFDWTPVDWLYKFNYIKYLMVVIPGTFAGDMLMRHGEFREPEGHGRHGKWALAVAAYALVVICLWSMFTREVETGFLIALPVMGVGLLVGWRDCSVSPQMRKMLQWGTWAVISGFIFEPIEGGIHKQPTHVAYWLLTSGLAFWQLVAWLAMTEGATGKKSWGWLAAVGMNPLLGYVAMTNFVPSVVRLSQLDQWVGAQNYAPWTGFWYAVFEVGIIVLVCNLGTKWKLFLKT